MITQNKGRFEILGFVNLIMSSEQYHLYCDMLLVMLSVNRWGDLLCYWFRPLLASKSSCCVGRSIRNEV